MTEQALVYLPSERAQRGDAEVTVEFRRIDDGRLVVLAYTSLDALVDGCGDRQPWVSLPAESIGEIVQASGADEVLWNQALPAEQRRESSAGGNA